jgi:hypothetical protein
LAKPTDEAAPFVSSRRLLAVERQKKPKQTPPKQLQKVYLLDSEDGKGKCNNLHKKAIDKNIRNLIFI